MEKKLVRFVCLSLVVASSVLFVVVNVGADQGTDLSEIQRQSQLPMDERTQVVPERSNVTVVSYQFGQLVAFAPDGRLLYYDEKRPHYWDVDPSPAGRYTVLIVSSEYLETADGCGVRVCTNNIVELVNLSTGDRMRVYEHVVPGKVNQEWHDVDRLNDGDLLVGDMPDDRAAVVDPQNGTVEWAWHTQMGYDIAGGGSFPDDWTHLNDVERVGEDRIMLSLRNQDQVVFVSRDAGLLTNLTIGDEDDHSILYEQHNPDYIPPRAGGPAVLIGDSENNRVVEYQRVNGTWERTWMWRDEHTRWPRDADRLPGGHTLITDSNGNRVVEVDREGEVVWSVSLPYPYDAERLGTGDESSGGPAAVRAGLTSDAVEADGRESSGPSDSVIISVLSVVLPQKWINALLFVTPPWMSLFDLFVGTGTVGVVAVWGTIEAYWSAYRLRWPVVRSE